MLQLMSIKAAEKKLRERGGESMNNQVVVNIDRISELPEVLILKILYFLPTKSALATSVLSKQFQFLWKMIPHLKFDYSDHKDEVGVFSKNVCSSLLLNTSPVIESLHLKFHSDYYRGVDFGTLIKTAKALHVRTLVLDAGYTNCYRIPKSFYNNETLETLILKACINLQKPYIVCMKSLKTLHLHALNITNTAMFLKILSGCPNLEDLLVRLYKDSRVTTLTIAHPTLQRLSVYNKRGPQHVWDCFINAPNLKYFCIEGDHSLRFHMSDNVTNLVEASVSDVNIHHIIDENVLGSLTSVEHLSLKSFPYKIPTASIFHQLVHLELFTFRGLRWELLTSMLKSSPKLQVLELIYMEPQKSLSWRDTLIWHMIIVDMASGKWKQPKNVPQCLLFHLKTFVWKCYCESLVEDDKEVMKYILRNANRLKRAIFSSKHMNFDDRLELESVVRASDSCQLLFTSNI